MSEELTKVIHVAVIVVLAVMFRFLALGVISRSVRRITAAAPVAGRVLPERDAPWRASARIATAETMLSSVATVMIGVVALLLILGEFDINLGPLLAGASVVGIAIGVGAQTLVKDLVAGLLILLEDQFGIGDRIESGMAVGTVERITLRSTLLRADNGALWHIPNGAMTAVLNLSKTLPLDEEEGSTTAEQ
jgi:small conductance mechanosensitive channel